jgi:hypothetical protein
MMMTGVGLEMIVNSDITLAKALVVALDWEKGMCGHNGYIAEQCWLGSISMQYVQYKVLRISV